MADPTAIPDTPEIRERWGAFAFDAATEAKAKEVIARYPAGHSVAGIVFGECDR